MTHSTTIPSVPRLEGFREFQVRLVRLNGLHNPEDPVHEHLNADESAWKERAQAHPEPDPATPLGRAVRSRKALVALHNQYPSTAPAWEQAAYLLRGMAGLQPFGLANDRTAWDYLQGVLLHHHITLDATERETDDLLSWLAQELGRRYPSGFQRSNLLDVDLLWSDLSGWFRHRVAQLGSRAEARLATA